jgi:hypothetical protein
VIDDPIDFDVQAPEAKVDFPSGVQFAQFQLTPLVQTEVAKQTLDRIRLVLAMWPQLCQRRDERRIGRSRGVCF